MRVSLAEPEGSIISLLSLMFHQFKFQVTTVEVQ